MSFLQQLKNSKGLCIYECTASMYVEAAKKWAQGKLLISPEGVCFECNEETHGFSSLSMDFSEICLLQKEASSYIFPSITFMVDKERKYWLGSFSNRDSVFNMLEHFWRECLFMTSKTDHLAQAGAAGSSASNSSVLGKDLLRIVYDSEKTLSHSATSLNRQGKQLDNAMTVAEDIRSDLEVADKKLSLIESWLGVTLFASTPKQQTPRGDASHVEYPAVFHRHDGSAKQKDDYLQGRFVIAPDSLTLIGYKEVVLYRFNKKDISTIYLISPWEIKIEQRRFGARDVCFSVITAKLVVAFTFLQRYFSEHIEMEAPRSSTPRKYRPSLDSSQSFGSDDEPTDDVAAADKFSVALSRIEAAQEQNLVSDAEARELSQVLHALKNLALEIHKEQDNQMHKIDELMASVDESDVRLKEDIRRIKRAM